MPKLTTRQWIILSVMILAIIYALYDFLTPKKQSAVDVKGKTQQLDAFISEVTAGMASRPLSELDEYIITRAEKEWKRDPFYEKKSFHEWLRFKNPVKTGGSESMKASFVYSGYLTVENRKIAIINDGEYGTGDVLDTGGYVLKHIYPDRVVIVNEKKGTKISVPLQE